MGAIRIDESRYFAAYHHAPENGGQGLWIFNIQERDICFWGRYADAASTAQRYAETRGLQTGTIQLIGGGCHPGVTRH